MTASNKHPGNSVPHDPRPERARPKRVFLFQGTKVIKKNELPTLLPTAHWRSQECLPVIGIAI